MMDHEAQALSRLIWQYKNAQKMRAFVRILPGEVDEHFEAAADKIINALDIPNRSGAQLDVIGAVVGQPRTGPAVGNDPLYRSLLRSRIAKNSSDGSIDSIATAVEQIAGSAVFEVADNQDMTFELVFEEELTDEFKTLLREFDVVPRPQGVRLTGAKAPSNSPPFGYKLVGKAPPAGIAGYGLIVGGNPPTSGGYYALIYEVK